MAHSHVQRMLREAMELDEVKQDCDGDYPMRHGSAMYYLSVGRTGHMVKIWSHAVYGLKDTAAVLREVNEANEQLLHCRVYLAGGTLMVEAFLPVEPLVPAYLAAVCCEVGTVSDRMGQLMAAVHGGIIAVEFESEDAG
jgi:hypothetical protein